MKHQRRRAPSLPPGVLRGHVVDDVDQARTLLEAWARAVESEGYELSSLVAYCYAHDGSLTLKLVTRALLRAATSDREVRAHLDTPAAPGELLAFLPESVEPNGEVIGGVYLMPLGRTHGIQ